MPYEFHVALLCFANCYRWRMKDEKTVRFDSSYCCQKKTTHQQSCIKLRKRYIQVFRPYDMPNKLSTLLFFFCMILTISHIFSSIQKESFGATTYLSISICNNFDVNFLVCTASNSYIVRLIGCISSGEEKFLTFIFHIDSFCLKQVSSIQYTRYTDLSMHFITHRLFLGECIFWHDENGNFEN